MAPGKLNTEDFPSISYCYLLTKMTAELLRRCRLRARTTHQHPSIESVIVSHLMVNGHDTDALKDALRDGQGFETFALETKISALKDSDETSSMALGKRPIVF